MKKFISGFLSVSLVASTLSTLPINFKSNVVSATSMNSSSISNDTNVSVTDLNKYENNDIIITYKKTSNATQKKTLSICGLSDTSVSGAEVSKLTDNSVVLKLDSDEDLETAIETLSQDNRIEYIQPNYIYHLFDNDVNSIYNSISQNTYFSSQWGLYNDGTMSYSESSSNSFWGRPTTTTIQATKDIDINLLNAWSICASPKRDTVVAIVDTGVMYDHEDLAEHMWTNTDEIAGDGIDNDGNGYIDDVYGWNFFDESVYTSDYLWEYSDNNASLEGNNTYYNKNSDIEDAHGTHGAGTITASNNKIGTVGIASNANVKIMSVKALGGDEGYGTTESVVQAIQYAEENGAHICNLSLGSEDDDITLRSIIENSSMLFTIAAGNGDEVFNHAMNIDKTPMYPASYEFDNIITVANLQCNGKLHPSSNYGTASVDFAAPGSYIYSTSTGDGTSELNSSIPASSNYEYMSGTSMAAPMAAGVAAMLYSCYDNLTLQDIKKILLESVTPLTSLSGKCVSNGTLNAYAAVQLAEKSSMLPTDTPMPTATITPKTFEPLPTIYPEETITPTNVPTETPIYTDIPTKTPVYTTAPTEVPVQTTVPTEAPVYTTTPTKAPVQTTVPTKTPVYTTTPTKAPEYTTVPTKTPVYTTTPMYTKQPMPTSTNGGSYSWYTNSPVTPSPIPTDNTPATIAPASNIVPTATFSLTPFITNTPSSTIATTTLPAAPTVMPATTFVPKTPQQTTTLVPVATSTPVYNFLTIQNLTISNHDMYYIGHSYTFAPKVSGGNGNYQYRYQVSKNGKIYVNKAYSKKTSFKWTPTVSGNYQVKVSVKDSNGYDDYYSLNIYVSKMKIKSLKVNKTLKTLKKGVTAKFTANANSGYGTLTYKFTIKKVNSTYCHKQSSKKNTFIWKIPSKGIYKLTLQITDSKKNQIQKTYTLKIKK